MIITNPVLNFSPFDWMIINAAGNNPFLSQWEIAYLLAISSTQPNLGIQRMTERLAAIKKKVQHLIDNQFLQSVEGIDRMPRLIPSERAIQYYAAYHATDVSNIQRFQPWPQKKSLEGNVTYATNWFSKRAEHEHLSRQFALALLFGGRSIANNLGWPKIQLRTTIGGRIILSFPNKFGEKTFEWVTPDAVLQAEIWKCPNPNYSTIPTLVARQLLYVEIDRSTYALTKLDDRLDQYKLFWPYLRDLSPVFVWVIDGTPYREKEILEKMRKRGLEGWTVTLDRLILNKNHSYWSLNPPVFGNLEFDSVGGLAPYRPIWRHTSPKDQTMNDFLGAAPWQAYNRLFDVE